MINSPIDFLFLFSFCFLKKSRFSRKMASATKEQQVTKLFTELKSAVDDYDDELSLQLCDKLLKLNPDDQLTLQCKVVTLIRLEKYKEALTMIARQFRDSDIDLSYEKIYCYYRTNQLLPAMELLQELKSKSSHQDPSLLYLEAQLVKYIIFIKYP